MKYTALALILSLSASAQSSSVYNALFANTGQSSARYTATAGAMTAMGADPGAVVTNPAGIAMYRDNHFNVGIGQNMTGVNDGTQLTHLGYTYARNLGRHFGLAATFQYATDQWQGDWSHHESSPEDRMVDNLLSDVMGAGAPEDLMSEGHTLPYAAYQGYILEYDDALGEYFSLAEGMPTSRTQRYKMGYGGSQSVFGLAFRGPRFSIGWSTLSERRNAYEALVIHEEGYSGYTSSYALRMADSMSFQGYSHRVGAIVRLEDGVQVGMHVSRPSVGTTDWDQKIRVTPETEMDDSAFELFDEGEWHSSTPLRMGIAISQVYESQGFASAEYHYSDFADPLIISPLTEVSTGYAIANELQHTHEFRFGGEVRDGIIAYRGGLKVVSSGSIYQDHSAFSQLSGGIGIIQDAIQFNIAASMSHRIASITDPVKASPWELSDYALRIQAGLQMKL